MDFWRGRHREAHCRPMMAFRSRKWKPDEDIQVFAYNLEALLRRAMPALGENQRDTLLKQQLVKEGAPVVLKKEHPWSL